MSGDMNTSLGNVLLMTAMVHSYFHKIGVTNFDLINDGDDCVVFFDESNLHHVMKGLQPWFTDMGFTMKCEKPVYELEQIEFCQAQPVFDGEKYIMVRNIRTALAKDCVSIKPLSTPTILRKWLIAVGEGGMSLTGGIPIWQEFYTMLLRSGARLPKGRRPSNLKNDPTFDTGLRRLCERMGRVYQDIRPETRYSFWLAYGITPDEQIAMEHYYSSGEADIVWDHELMGDMVPVTFFP